MSTFFYRCSNTGFKVKGWVADDPTKDEAFELLGVDWVTKLSFLSVLATTSAYVRPPHQL
jgi:hypothetical protein